MTKIDKLIDTFVTGDYFIIFLVLTLIILLVLIVALIKSREDYNELLSSEKKKMDNNDNIDGITAKEVDVMDELESLKSTNKDDEFDEDKPLIKQINLSSIDSYTSDINKYENLEEENAVISAEELERKTKERLETLGVSNNQEAIQKYEEEQENKAIISYEQLLKNASNINLSYKDETKNNNAPRVQKIELEERKVSEPEVYVNEEEFLKILKEFRISLQ